MFPEGLPATTSTICYQLEQNHSSHLITFSVVFHCFYHDIPPQAHPVVLRHLASSGDLLGGRRTVKLRIPVSSTPNWTAGMLLTKNTMNRKGVISTEQKSEFCHNDNASKFGKFRIICNMIYTLLSYAVNSRTNRHISFFKALAVHQPTTWGILISISTSKNISPDSLNSFWTKNPSDSIWCPWQKPCFPLGVPVLGDPPFQVITGGDMIGGHGKYPVVAMFCKEIICD